MQVNISTESTQEFSGGSQDCNSSAVGRWICPLIRRLAYLYKPALWSPILKICKSHAWPQIQGLLPLHIDCRHHQFTTEPFLLYTCQALQSSSWHNSKMEGGTLCTGLVGMSIQINTNIIENGIPSKHKSRNRPSYDLRFHSEYSEYVQLFIQGPAPY